MGCFDTVIIRCPHCGSQDFQQTKAGKCEMRTYSLKNMPLEIATGIIGKPFDCEHCGKRYMVEAQYVIQCQVVPLSEEDDDFSP